MRRLWIAIVIAATIAIAFGFVSSDLLGRRVAPSFEISLVYLAFLLAGAALFIRHLANGRVALTIGATIVLTLVAGHRSYVILAYLLITMIHMFVFTACFVLFGALKSGSRRGMISLGMFFACAMMLLFAPAPPIATSAAIVLSVLHVLLEVPQTSDVRRNRAGTAAEDGGKGVAREARVNGSSLHDSTAQDCCSDRSRFRIWEAIASSTSARRASISEAVVMPSRINAATNSRSLSRHAASLLIARSEGCGQMPATPPVGSDRTTIARSR